MNGRTFSQNRHKRGKSHHHHHHHHNLPLWLWLLSLLVIEEQSRCPFWRFYSESARLWLCCNAPACGSNIAATLRVYRSEWLSVAFWLAEAVRVTDSPGTLNSPLPFPPSSPPSRRYWLIGTRALHTARVLSLALWLCPSFFSPFSDRWSGLRARVDEKDQWQPWSSVDSVQVTDSRAKSITVDTILLLLISLVWPLCKHDYRHPPPPPAVFAPTSSQPALRPRHMRWG